MNSNLTDKDMTDFMGACNLPAIYQKKDIGLSDFGEIGEEIKPHLVSRESRKAYLGEKRILNIYSNGDGGCLGDRFYFMVMREIIISECILGEMLPACVDMYKLMRGHERQQDLYENADVIGFDEFYLVETAQEFPYSDDQYTILRRCIRDHVGAGGLLIVGSDRPLAELECYPSGLHHFIMENGKDLCVGTRA